jgi:hypothetical protein
MLRPFNTQGLSCFTFWCETNKSINFFLYTNRICIDYNTARSACSGQHKYVGMLLPTLRWCIGEGLASLTINKDAQVLCTWKECHSSHRMHKSIRCIARCPPLTTYACIRSHSNVKLDVHASGDVVALMSVKDGSWGKWGSKQKRSLWPDQRTVWHAPACTHHVKHRAV